MLFDQRIAVGLRPGSVVIDMSSGADATFSIAERLAQSDIQLIDAPVSGGVKKATSGELAIMIGAATSKSPSRFLILRAMGKSITWAGPVGCGRSDEGAEQPVSAGGFLIGVEALLVGKKFGLDPGVMVDILNASKERITAPT